MWSAAGMRVSEQKNFHENEPEDIRALYRQTCARQFAVSKSGERKIQECERAGWSGVGRWAWCVGRVGLRPRRLCGLVCRQRLHIGAREIRARHVDASSFFWRQVVGKSPQNASASPDYERGWNAINELIRSDASWNGYERNVFYANNRDGTFSEVSGAVGIGFSGG